MGGVAVRNALTRLRWVRGSTWGLLAAATALIGGVAAWVPVPWPQLALQYSQALKAWGVFEPPGLVTLAASGVLLGLLLARRRSRRPAGGSVRPLRRWVVALAAVAIVSTVVAAGWFLLELAAHARDAATARLEAVRTALTLGAGLVGVVALWLTGRKQWLAERTQRHAEDDAIEQRVTQLYTAAADQLASDKAPVRMAGMYALERLGQNNPGHRQTIVNLLCAYLRMPYTHPAVAPAEGDPAAAAAPRETATAIQPVFLDLAPALAEAAGLVRDGAEQQRQELEVRRTAEKLLIGHLRTFFDKHGHPTNPAFWGGPDNKGMHLDLAGATLHQWDFRHCRVRGATFDGAQFLEEAWFFESHFNGGAGFSGAVFHGSAGFGGTRFHSSVGFDGASFNGTATFVDAWFHAPTVFFGARFHCYADFHETHFHGPVAFDGAWGRLDHDSASSSRWPDGWVAVEDDYSDGGDGRWGRLEPAEAAESLGPQDGDAAAAAEAR